MAEMTAKQKREMKAIAEFRREEAANAGNETAGNSNNSKKTSTKQLKSGATGKTKGKTNFSNGVDALTGKATQNKVNKALNEAGV